MKEIPKNILDALYDVEIFLNKTLREKIPHSNKIDKFYVIHACTMGRMLLIL